MEEEPRVCITRFAAHDRPLGTRATLEWSGLARLLATTHQQGLGWAPATFNGDRRRGDNVERVHALVFDYDHPGESLVQIKARWARNLAIIHTSKSHSPEEVRCRVVLALSRPVTAAEHARVWHAMRPHAGNVDEACKDASRFWFLPSLTPHFSSDALPGDPLDVDALLQDEDEPTAPESAPLPRRQVQEAPAVPPPSRQKIAPARAWVRKADPAIQGENGSQKLMRVCAYLRGKGLPLDVAEQIVLEEYNPRCVPPWSIPEIQKKLRDATASPPSNLVALPTPAPPPGGAPQVLERGDHADVGALLIEELQKEGRVLADEGCFWRYSAERGVFTELPEDLLSRTVQSFAGRPVKSAGKDNSETRIRPLKVNAKDVDGTIRLGRDRVTESGFFGSARPGVAFRNGFAVVTAAGVQLEPHAEEHRARHALECEYQPDAVPVRWLVFLNETFRGDPDIDAKCALMQEAFGAALSGLRLGTALQKALVWVGEGRNGKGVASKVLEGCMPPGSVAAIPPQHWDEPYFAAQLAGIRLNLVSELPKHDLTTSDAFKAIVAGDACPARHPAGRPFTFTPRALHIFSANDLPGTRDHGYAYWERFLLVQFNNTVAPENRNPNLAAELLEAERPAIVAWALEGARRLLQQSRFTEPASHRTALEQWKRDADAVALFLEEATRDLALEADNTAGAGTTELFNAFREWARDNGHLPMSHVAFSKRLGLLGYKQVRTSGPVNRRYRLVLDSRGRGDGAVAGAGAF